MAVLVYIENVEGTIKKSGFEAAYCASQQQRSVSEAVGLVIGRFKIWMALHLGLSKDHAYQCGIRRASMDFTIRK